MKRRMQPVVAAPRQSAAVSVRRCSAFSVRCSMFDVPFCNFPIRVHPCASVVKDFPSLSIQFHPNPTLKNIFFSRHAPAPLTVVHPRFKVRTLKITKRTHFGNPILPPKKGHSAHNAPNLYEKRTHFARTSTPVDETLPLLIYFLTESIAHMECGEQIPRSTRHT
jgi:hypothetical protein